MFQIKLFCAATLNILQRKQDSSAQVPDTTRNSCAMGNSFISFWNKGTNSSGCRVLSRCRDSPLVTRKGWSYLILLNVFLRPNLILRPIISYDPISHCDPNPSYHPNSSYDLNQFYDLISSYDLTSFYGPISSYNPAPPYEQNPFMIIPPSYDNTSSYDYTSCYDLPSYDPTHLTIYRILLFYFPLHIE